MNSKIKPNGALLAFATTTIAAAAAASQINDDSNLQQADFCLKKHSAFAPYVSELKREGFTLQFKKNQNSQDYMSLFNKKIDSDRAFVSTTPIPTAIQINNSIFVARNMLVAPTQIQRAYHNISVHPLIPNVDDAMHLVRAVVTLECDVPSQDFVFQDTNCLVLEMSRTHEGGGQQFLGKCEKFRLTARCYDGRRPLMEFGFCFVVSVQVIRRSDNALIKEWSTRSAKVNGKSRKDTFRDWFSMFLHLNSRTSLLKSPNEAETHLMECQNRRTNAKKRQVCKKRAREGEDEE